MSSIDQTFYDVAMGEADSFVAAGYFVQTPQVVVPEAVRKQIADAWDDRAFYDETMAELGVLAPPASTIKPTVTSSKDDRLNRQFWSRMSFKKAMADVHFSFRNMFPNESPNQSNAVVRAINATGHFFGASYAVVAVTAFYTASTFFNVAAVFLLVVDTVVRSATSSKRRE